MLFIKDHDAHPEDEDRHLDDDWHPSYPRLAAWLLNADDAAVPPLQVHLPASSDGWKGVRGGCSWSLVLCRGNLEELAPSVHMRWDSAPRLYLLEAGAEQFQLWASRRVDESFDTIYQRDTLDGREILRHSLSFSPVPHSQLYGLTDVAAGGSAASWQLWSPELRHAARVASALAPTPSVPSSPAGAGTSTVSRVDDATRMFGGSGSGTVKMTFWRCRMCFAGESEDIRAQHPCAYTSVAEATPKISPVEVLSYGRRGWEGHPRSWEAHGLPQADTSATTLVTGLPCFPTHRRGESTVARPEDRWLQTLGQDATLHIPQALHF